MYFFSFFFNSTLDVVWSLKYKNPQLQRYNKTFKEHPHHWSVHAEAPTPERVWELWEPWCPCVCLHLRDRQREDRRLRHMFDFCSQCLINQQSRTAGPLTQGYLVSSCGPESDREMTGFTTEREGVGGCEGGGGVTFTSGVFFLKTVKKITFLGGDQKNMWLRQMLLNTLCINIYSYLLTLIWKQFPLCKLCVV